MWDFRGYVFPKHASCRGRTHVARDGASFGTCARGIHSWCQAYTCVATHAQVVALRAYRILLSSVMLCEIEDESKWPR